MNQLLQQLETNGFVKLDNWYPSKELRQQVQEQIQTLIAEQKLLISDGQDGREFYHVENNIISTLLQSILDQGLRDLLKQYMKSPECRCCSIVVVPRKAKRQIVHKDHASGVRLVTCLALSLNDDELIQTYFRTGTHKSKDGSDEIGYRHMEPINAKLVLYDTQIEHAGAENPSDEPSMTRLFFSFTNSRTTKQILEENAIFNGKPIKL